jgi:hypothetical protein
MPTLDQPTDPSAPAPAASPPVSADHAPADAPQPPDSGATGQSPAPGEDASAQHTGVLRKLRRQFVDPNGWVRKTLDRIATPLIVWWIETRLRR